MPENWLIMDRKVMGKWKGKGNWATPVELFNNSDSSGKVR